MSPPRDAPRLLVRAVIVAVAMAPGSLGSRAAHADPPDPADRPVDAGESPTRTSQATHALTVAVQGVGPTPELARADAERRRDEAIVAALRDRAHPLQVQGAVVPGGSWPGAEVTEREDRTDGVVRVSLEVRFADVRPLTTAHPASGVRLAWRLSPRAGIVVLDHDSSLHGLEPGDVLDEALGVTGIQNAIAFGTPLRVTRGGQILTVTPTRELREDTRKLAPTCGPCCHGGCDERIKPWDDLHRAD